MKRMGLLFLATAIALVAGCFGGRAGIDTSGISDSPAAVQKRVYRYLERDIKGLHARNLDEVIKLPDEEIDIATAALLISKEIDPGLDVKKYAAMIDEMAKELASGYLSFPMTDRQVVEAFSSYLFSARRFLFTPSLGPQFTLLDKTLESRKGDCAGLTLIYLSLAERLGVPLKAVCLPDHSLPDQPGHAFIRFTGGCGSLNIEPTAGGLIVSDSYYRKEFKDALGIMPNALETVLTKKRFIALLAVNLAELDNIATPSIVRILKEAVSLWPGCPIVLVCLGVSCLKTGDLEQGVKILRKVITDCPAYPAAWAFLFEYYFYERNDYDSAVELGREYLKLHAGHPDADKLRFRIYCALVDSSAKTRYKLESVDECDEALEFIKSLEGRYTEIGIDQHVAEALDRAVKRRKKELLQGKKK
jgi:regulator of sirC expression with transglutaminase-like and TPR domain